MTPITPPLKSGDRGGAVGNLQEALLLFLEKRLIQPRSEEATSLIELLRSEQRGPGYGSGTAKAVTLFQEKRLLQSTGAVDAATAEAMNGFLKGFGAIRPNPDTVVFAVNGKVTSRDRAGVGGLRVAIVDKNVGEGRDILLAEAITNGDGSYRTTFIIGGLLQRGKERPDLQARVFAGERFLGASKVSLQRHEPRDPECPLDGGRRSALPSELETLTVRPLHALQGQPARPQGDGRAAGHHLSRQQDRLGRPRGGARGAGRPVQRRNSDCRRRCRRSSRPSSTRSSAPDCRPTKMPLYQIDARRPPLTSGSKPSRKALFPPLEAGIPRRPSSSRGSPLSAAWTVRAGRGLVAQGDADGFAGDDPGTPASASPSSTRTPGRSAEALGSGARRASAKQPRSACRLDGQLAYLTLNNAPLIRKLHAAGGQTG